MTSDGFLDVNHCPKQTVIPDLEDEVIFSGADFYENDTNWPTRNEDKGGSDGFIEDFIEGFIENPHSQMQQQSNWQAERALPHSTSVFQHGSGLPSQMPASQEAEAEDGQVRSCTRKPKLKTARPDKRKQTSNSESGEDGKTNLMYPCKFCGKTFSKSQALGGHTNMHRKEKKDEQYKEALHIVEEQGGQQQSFRQILHSSLVDLISRVPMQTHQQRNFYHAASLNNPYALDQYLNDLIHEKLEYLTSAANQIQPPYERRNHDTMLGMPYERNHFSPSDPTNTSGLLPPVGSQGMHPNYLPQQARESISVVSESRFNPGFQSLGSYPMQPEVYGAEFLSQASQAQQFNFHYSVPSSFHSPGIGQFTMEGETAQDRQTTRSINIHGEGSSSLSPEIYNKHNQYFPQDP